MVNLLYKMAIDLQPLFELFADGLTWLAELRERLLVSASVMVRTWHWQDLFWEDLEAFFERLLLPQEFFFPTTEREVNTTNRFFQVCQEVSTSTN